MTTVNTGPMAIGANDRDVVPGTEIGEYRVETEIGKGGFGTVYRAVHPLIGKQVAIKVLARRYSADDAIVRRFIDEARAVNQIRHRNIIDIFAFGQLADGRHYYIMELLDGQPLDTYLDERGALTLDQALPILRAIARALDAAHAKGIAHRDLKPENIFLARDPDGAQFPKLLDFGIAKLMAPDDDVRQKTGTGVPLGTPYYMSPEQCRGKNVDPRTDIYSFGVLVYRMLTATYPFTGDDYMDLMIKQINEEPEPPSKRNPSVSSAVDHAVAWMMRKDPSARPKTLATAVAALEGHGLADTSPALSGSSSAIGLAMTTPAGTLPPVPRARRWWLIAAPVVVALASGGGYLALRGGAERATPSPTATATVSASPSPSPSPSPPPSSPPPPAPAPAPPKHPDHVIVEVKGAPEGTAVVIAGVKKGITPMVQLDYGDQPVILDFELDGYAPAQARVTPSSDQAVTVTLKKKPPRPAQHQPGRDDLADPFGRAP